MKKEKEIVEGVVVDKEEKVKEENKTYFFPRLVAYIIDILLITIVCTGLGLIIPEDKNYDKYVEEYNEIIENYSNDTISSEKYLNQLIDVSYDLNYSTCLNTIVDTLVVILYFIVFQFYNKGQTLGKKLMKLRVVSNNDDKASINQIAIHSLIANSILSDILGIGILLFVNRNYYYYIYLGLDSVFSIIVMVCIFMVLFRKDGRGLHDILAKTKVIQER